MNTFNNLAITMGSIVYSNTCAINPPPELVVIEIWDAHEMPYRMIKTINKATKEIIFGKESEFRLNKIIKGFVAGDGSDEKELDKLPDIFNIDNSEYDKESMFAAASVKNDTFVKFISDSDMDDILHIASKLQYNYRMSDVKVESILENSFIKEYNYRYEVCTPELTYTIRK